MFQHESASAALAAPTDPDLETVGSYVPAVTAPPQPAAETVWNWVSSPEQVWPLAPSSAAVPTATA